MVSHKTSTRRRGLGFCEADEGLQNLSGKISNMEEAHRTLRDQLLGDGMGGCVILPFAEMIHVDHYDYLFPLVGFAGDL